MPGPDGVRFRVWAPTAERVDLLLEGGPARPLAPRGDGTWAAHVPGIGEGARYRYRVDGGEPIPDPYARSQPEGVHGPSEVVDLASYAWQDHGWPGLRMPGLVVYECHVGTATAEGTFDALVGQLDRLRALGVNAIELMPVAEFSGTRSWGYDGVDLFAPSRSYGGPRGLQRLVDAAHVRGLGIILDVVYNHLGPEGNYLRQYSPHYFTDRYQTPWGAAINYDGAGSAWVRKLVLDNALAWIHAYHVDGLRLDAVHAIRDRSPRHLLAELTETVRGSLPPERSVVLIAETDQNDVRYPRPVVEGGYGLDAVWADDLHHGLRRYLAGDHEGYYADYAGTLAEVARTLEQGWLYEGQPSRHLNRPRGTPARDRPAWQFQVCLQNHDQVGNRAFGERLHHQLSLDQYRAASALLCLVPYSPLLFMGQEFAASTPFQYFTDHSGDLGRLVTEGRRGEFGGFAQFADPAAAGRIPDPQAEETFLRSKLRLEEIGQPPGAQVHALYAELLRLRRADAVIAGQDRQRLRARAVSADVLAVTLGSGSAAGRRLLLANFGEATEARLSQALAEDAEEEPAAPGSAEPDVARERGDRTPDWRVLLSTDEPRFGGEGRAVAVEAGRVKLPARTAVLLAASGGDA